MDSFFSLFHYEFFQNILVVSILSSLLAGIAGFFLEINDLSSTAGSIAHTILAGVGLATYFMIAPFWGALLIAMIASFILACQRIYFPHKIQLMGNILWGSGMALGVLFVSFSKGYQQSLTNFLFGNILLISKTDIYQIASLDVIIISLVCLFFRQLILLSFNMKFARLQGLKVFILTYLLLLIISFSVINLVKTVGISLALILLSVPTHIAENFSQSIFGAIAISFMISIFSTLIGFYLSYRFNLPAGAVIVLVCLSFYMFLGMKKLIKKK